MNEWQCLVCVRTSSLHCVSMQRSDNDDNCVRRRVEWQIQSTHLTRSRSRHRYLLRSFMQTSVNKCEEKKRPALGTARECVNYLATSERTSASNFTKEKRMWISWLCCIATAFSVQLIVCWNVGSRAAGNLHNHSGTECHTCNSFK